MKMSPEPLASIEPVRPKPKVTRFAMRLSWSGVSGASVLTITMMDPRSVSSGRAFLWPTCCLQAGRLSVAHSHRRIKRSRDARFVTHDLPSDRDAGNSELRSTPVITLEQYADGVAAQLGPKLSGGRARPSLEAVTVHPCATANISFLDLTSTCGIQRLQGVLLLHVLTFHIVEPYVCCLGNNRVPEGGPRNRAEPSTRLRRRGQLRHSRYS